MSKFLKIFLIILFTFNSIFISYWDWTTSWWKWDAITVKVTEKIPWAWCSAIKDPKTNLYTCTIQPGFNTIQAMIGQIIKWFTALAALAWVLFIVINWILLSTWWDWKDEIKKRIVKTLTWLILLLLSWLILSMIAPWVYR